MGQNQLAISSVLIILFKEKERKILPLKANFTVQIVISTVTIISTG